MMISAVPPEVAQIKAATPDKNGFVHLVEEGDENPDCLRRA
jgi:hypothetical protein